MSGLASAEWLLHLQCGYCGGWWSVGDAPSDRREWTCTWCGEVNVPVLDPGQPRKAMVWLKLWQKGWNAKPGHSEPVPQDEWARFVISTQPFY